MRSGNKNKIIIAAACKIFFLYYSEIVLSQAQLFFFLPPSQILFRQALISRFLSSYWEARFFILFIENVLLQLSMYVSTSQNSSQLFHMFSPQLKIMIHVFLFFFFFFFRLNWYLRHFFSQKSIRFFSVIYWIAIVLFVLKS